MKIIRVFAGNDGESHFEEVPFAEMQGIVDRVGPGDININRREAPNFSDYHQAPRRQYVVNLEGIAEFECADGSKIQMEPGDILVAEDLSGHGHIARSPFAGMRTSLAIPLAEPD